MSVAAIAILSVMVTFLVLIILLTCLVYCVCHGNILGAVGFGVLMFAFVLFVKYMFRVW